MSRLGALRRRLERLREPAAFLVAGAELGDALEGAHNRRYLSGFRGDSGLLWITATDAALITDSRFWDQAERECPDWRLVRQAGQSQAEVVAELARAAGIGVVAFNPTEVSYQTYLAWRRRLEGVRLRPVRGWIEDLRVQKEPDEVAAIAQAQTLVDAVFDAWRDTVRPGVSERALAVDLEFRLRRAGADGMAFPVIVATGAHGAQPHAIPGDARLEPGDLVVVDVGARVDGYCSDMTRTLTVPGAPVTEEARRAYQIVAEALRAGVAALGPGVSAKAVDAAARQVIVDAGYGEAFGHGTGHGVGLAVHEAPGLSPRADPAVTVPAGAVVTVEPGIYVPGRFGVRLEELVHVTAEGPRILSRTPLD